MKLKLCNRTKRKIGIRSNRRPFLLKPIKRNISQPLDEGGVLKYVIDLLVGVISAEGKTDDSEDSHLCHSHSSEDMGRLDSWRRRHDPQSRRLPPWPAKGWLLEKLP
jgi:hypothetical protein